MLKRCYLVFLFVCFKYLFIWLHQGHSCSMWDLVPWPGIELRFPALGAWSLDHWTTREVPTVSLFIDLLLLPSILVVFYYSQDVDLLMWMTRTVLCNGEVSKVRRPSIRKLKVVMLSLLPGVIVKHTWEIFANCKGPYRCKGFDSPIGIAAARLWLG